jgi:hypothetical protein
MKLSKSNKQLLLSILLFLPLFFINIQDEHNWGDDFALYLHQAKNLVEGESPQETGLIFNEDNPIMVSSVSIGFSILLAPVYVISKGSILAFSYYMTFFLVLAAIALLVFFRKRFPFWLSLVLVLLIVYNRWVLDFKYNILSDIPFLALLFILINLFEKKWKNDYLKFIILGVVAGFVMSVRTLGIVFVLAVIAISLYELISYRVKEGGCAINARQRMLQLMIFAVLSIGFYKFLDAVFFPEPKNGSYIGYLQEHNIWEVFVAHLGYYYNFFCGFFHTFKIPREIHLFNVIIVSTFLFSGFILKLFRKIEITDFFFIGFLLVVFAYPANPGFRYLLPLIPFVFIYVAESFVFLARILKIEKKFILASAFFVILLMQYEPGIARMARPEKLDKIYGPQLPESKEVFNYIRENTADTSVFVFIKPRAFSLYTDRQCLANNKRQRDTDSLNAIYRKHNVDYLLQNYNEIIDSPMLMYVEAYEDQLEKVFENEHFRLYRFVD